MELTISRKVWLRGIRSGPSALLRIEVDGSRKQCCIGILATACGVEDESLLGYSDLLSALRLPSNLVTGLPVRPDNLAFLMDDATSDKLASYYRMNDNPLITDVHREAELTKMFAADGITVTFVD